MFCKTTLFRCYHHFFHIHYTRKNRFLASAKYRFLCLIYLIRDIGFHSALRNPKCYGKLRIQVAFCHPQITLVSRRDLLSLLQAGHLPLIKGLDDPHPFCTFATFHAFLVLFLSSRTWQIGDGSMKKMTGKNTLMLFLTAFIWGTAFVAQSVGMDYIGPFTFTCVRSLIGGIFLIPCICFLDKWRAENDGAERQKKADRKEEKKNVILGGICCGLALCVASNLQQIGIQYTTVGKAGFITALYIVLVPIFGIFLKKKAGVRIWISVAISVAGLYLLCITDKLVLAKGDILVLLCAVVFTIHILVIDYFSPKADSVRIACTQFFITGVLSAIPMFLFETPRLSDIFAAAVPVLYAGVLSSGVAYTLQIVAQKDADPTVASLILSLESVFSVLGGWVILGQKLSIREIAGCILMFSAIILAQLPGNKEA